MSSKRGVEFIRQIAKFMKSTKGFDRVTEQLAVTGGGKGNCTVEFQVAKEHINSNGYLHGGFIATIVDNVTTYALMSYPCHPGVSVELRVAHMDQAKLGDEIIVDASTVRAGKNLAHIDCVLRRKSDSAIIAKGAQTKYVSFG